MGDDQWTLGRRARDGRQGQGTATMDKDVGKIFGSIYRGCVKKIGKGRKVQVGEGRPPLYRHNALHDIPCSGNP